jgi:hypothetical protein
MTDLWQTIVVVVAVAAAAFYLAMQWMPARWRRAVAERLAHGSRRLGLREARADRLAQSLARKGGCGSCSGCGGCGTAAGTGTGEAAVAAAGQVVAVPLVRQPRRG